MDREEVLRIGRLLYFESYKLTPDDIRSLLRDYCQEHGKPQKETSIFISFLFNRGIIESFFIEALEYYERKYSINKLKSKPDQVGQRHIISIY